MVANHISNGMYGLILVEPAGGLPKVDREFYIMQGELYTNAPFGSPGLQEMNIDKLVDEHPDYFTFNGSVGALTSEHPLKAKVGDSIRIFFGVGGPNFTSSFHVIGQIFDRAWEDGAISSTPMTGVQTVSTPPGSATMVEFQAKVPGKYTIVDHALSRLEHGLAGTLIVTGPEQPDLFRAGPAAAEKHSGLDGIGTTLVAWAAKAEQAAYRALRDVHLISSATAAELAAAPICSVHAGGTGETGSRTN